MKLTHDHVQDVLVNAGSIKLEGYLGVPEGAVGVVLFAHGSGSGRLSVRNNAVAAQLRAAGLATLLFDLLTPMEAQDRSNVFDIELLADRLRAASLWVASLPQTNILPIGYFGASTGAAAALVAAAGDGNTRAVVSRGGRPDLAGGALDNVRAPTLLLVGGLDWGVIELNQQAYERLRCPKELIIIPGAGHLFEEAGALDQVSQHARDWFITHLARGRP